MIFQKRPVEGTEQNRMLLTEKRKNILLSLLMTGLFFLLLSIQYDFYYDLNDDTAIRDILSGAHSGTPSAYSIQMLIPLSWMLSACYRIIPQIPWFGMFLGACQMMCVYLIGYRLTELLQKWWTKITVWFVFLIVLVSTLLYQFVFIQYTVVCGMLMVTAAFRMGTEHLLEKEDYLDIVSIFLLVIAFQMRTEMCLMLMPFVGLILFCRWIQKGALLKRENLQEAYLGLSAALAVMSLCYLVNAIAYNGEAWKRFMNFFDQRTTLYDFIGIPEYEENEVFYEQNGIAKEEYQLLENYNFSLDQNWNNETFAKLIAHRQEQVGTVTAQPIYCYAGTYTTENLKGAVWSYKQSILYNQSGTWHYIILALYICTFMVASLQKKSFVYLKMLFLFAGRSIIWLYLLLRNRMPDRIIMPLYFMEAIVLLVWLVEELTSITQMKINMKRIKMWWTVGIALILVVASGTNLKAELNKTQAEYGRREQVNEKWQELQTYCAQNPQNYYVLDVYSTTQFSEKIYKAVDNSFKNYDLCGGWLAKSPLTEEKLLRFKITDLESALARQDGIYFIASADREISWLQDYYNSKEYRVNVEKCDTIADSKGTEIFVIYKLKDRKA